jgi:hypothetical protein
MMEREHGIIDKKSYAAPKLTVYGSIASLTRGNVSGTVDQGATKMLQLRPEENGGDKSPAYAGPEKSPW